MATQNPVANNPSPSPPENEVNPQPVLTEEITPASSVLGKRLPKNKSVAWNHFNPVPLEETQGEVRAQCKHCKRLIGAHPDKHGTNGMLKHLRRCKKNPHRSEEKGQMMLRFDEQGIEVGDGKKLIAHSFNPEECRKALAEFIICNEQAFKIVEDASFRKLLNRLEPRFGVPSRRTITRDCYTLYLDEKKKLKKIFKESNSRVCLTTDTWTSVQNFNYMCLTAHFIDKDWQLQKRIINFRQIENHKGDTIAKAIEKYLIEWDITRVMTITVDNASSNDSAISQLKKRFKSWNGLVCDGDFIHVRCCAHILNLVVSEGLKNLHSSIASIRTAVRYVRSSPARLLKFKAITQMEKITCKSSVCLDVPTRWNSTYMMLERAEKFQKVFDILEEEEEGYRLYFKDDTVKPPTDEDWHNARRFIQFLEVFYEVTCNLSASKYVTSNACFHEIVCVQTELAKWSISHDTCLGEMACDMMIKSNKYWGINSNMNALIFVAVVLDPRYKLEYVQWNFEDLYAPTEVTEMMRMVENVLNRLHNFYASEFNKSNAEENDADSTKKNRGDDQANTKNVSRVRKQNWKKQKMSKNSLEKTDLERYLMDECEDESSEFNILGWWKTNSSKYKILSLMARDILAIPMSTVSSESVFSTGGRVLDAYRSSLTPKMAEALVCLQNWISPLEFEFNEEYDQFDFTNDAIDDGNEGPSSAGD